MEKEGKDLSYQAKDRIERFLGTYTAGKSGETLVKISNRQKETLDMHKFKSDHPDLFSRIQENHIVFRIEHFLEPININFLKSYKIKKVL